MELEGVRSVFVSGSYVRGDWLDGRSDLDVGLVTDRDWERGFAEVQRVVSNAVGVDGFDSHEEGGIDWNLIDAASLPRTTRQAIDSPYPYFSVFRFDLDASRSFPRNGAAPRSSPTMRTAARLSLKRWR